MVATLCVPRIAWTSRTQCAARMVASIRTSASCTSATVADRSVTRRSSFVWAVIEVSPRHRHILSMSQSINLSPSPRTESRTQGKCPDSCLELYRPVCGSDGQVYLNDCYLRKQNCRRKVSKVEMSECVTPSGPCPTNCIAIYDPVCGSDRRLYINQCSMLRDNCARPVKSMPLQFCVGDQLHRL